jgi:hypothetical protein
MMFGESIGFALGQIQQIRAAIKATGNPHDANTVLKELGKPRSLSLDDVQVSYIPFYISWMR